MAEFTSRLVRKEEVANGTMAFYFEKPEGLEYIAGQHLSVKLINPVEMDDEGDERTFSFITIPSDSEVGVATRMRDTAFKRNLRDGNEVAVTLINPRGSMVLPKNPSRPLVFVAGGIGITPFISMIRQATEEQSEQKIYLFYSNRTIKDSPFWEELESLAKANTNFNFIPTMTQEDPGAWHGETGYITGEMIKKHVSETADTIFYLAGPTGFVSGLTDTLTGLGVDLLFIKSEDFEGYK